MVKKLISRTEFAKLAGVSAAAVTKACSKALKGATEGKRIDANHPDAVQYVEKQDAAKAPAPATGVDPMYENAIRCCRATGRWSASALREPLGIGSDRAKRIFGQIQAAGLVPAPGEKPPAPPAQVTPQQVEDIAAVVRPHIRGTAAAKEQRKAAASDEPVFEVPGNIEAFADMTLRELVEKFGTDVRFVDWLKATKAIEDINEKRIKNATASGLLINRALVQTGVIDVFNTAHLRLMKDGAKSIAAGVISKHAAGMEPMEIEVYVSDIIGSFVAPVKRKISRALGT